LSITSPVELVWLAIKTARVAPTNARTIEVSSEFYSR